MEFVEAMGIMKRMCKNQEGCTGCPIKELRRLPKSNGVCLYWIFEYPEKAEAILAKWNAGYPEKTLKDVFNDAFPTAPKHRGCAPDIPEICVSKVGYTPICQTDECCEQNCIRCWNQPYEEKTK